MHQFPFFSLPFLFKNLPFSQMIRLREHFSTMRDLGRIIRGGQVCGKSGDGILFYFISRRENETCVHLCANGGKKLRSNFRWQRRQQQCRGKKWKIEGRMFFFAMTEKKGNARKKKERIFSRNGALKIGKPERPRNTKKKSRLPQRKKAMKRPFFSTSHFPPTSIRALPRPCCCQWRFMNSLAAYPTSASLSAWDGGFRPKKKMNKTKAHLNFPCVTNSLLPLLAQIKNKGKTRLYRTYRCPVRYTDWLFFLGGERQNHDFPFI